MERCPTQKGHPISADACPFASSVPQGCLQSWVARIRAASDLECKSSLISLSVQLERVFAHKPALYLFG